MLALRLTEGLSVIDYEKKHGQSLLQSKKEIIDNYLKHGLVELDEPEARLRLTRKGFLLSNEVIAGLL
jgi:coproporphyrinogen III oxidase-like Fe-S oxidoreductase